MSVDRRVFVTGAACAAALPFDAIAAAIGDPDMYGLIGKMRAQAGRREELLQLLLADVAAMPGCLSYVVAKDPSDPDLIWITEAWESKDAHAASLTLPSVQALIAKARPLIAGMEAVAETMPVGGYGLAGGESVKA